MPTGPNNPLGARHADHCRHADAWTGQLDLNTSDLEIQSTAGNKAADFARLYNQVKQGFNDGTGTASASPAPPPPPIRAPTRACSLVDNALLGLHRLSRPRPVTANSILLKYTYYGDIDQNGQVDADDLTVFASNFGRTSGATQVDGDIDFNGAVNADDLTVFANNFNKGVGNPLAAASGRPVSRTSFPSSAWERTLREAPLRMRRDDSSSSGDSPAGSRAPRRSATSASRAWQRGPSIASASRSQAPLGNAPPRSSASHRRATTSSLTGGLEAELPGHAFPSRAWEREMSDYLVSCGAVTHSFRDWPSFRVSVAPQRPATLAEIVL